MDEKMHATLRLPDNFYLDPVVYPTTSRWSSKRVSLQRYVSDHFIPSLDSSVGSSPATTATSKHDDEGDNNDQTLSTFSILSPAPCRPPRPTRLDDLLLGFPYEARAIRDVWYPLANERTGHWELGVVRHFAKDAQPLKNVDYRFIEGVARKSVGVVEEVVDVPCTPPRVDTCTEHLAFDPPPKQTKRNRKTGKSSKRRGDKARNAYPYGFEIPELHVNARPYAEIEAEEALATET